MRILIGGAQFSNKGAQSMLFSVMDQFRRHYPGATVDYIPLDDYRKYAPGAYRFNVIYCGPQALRYEGCSLPRRCGIAAKALARGLVRKNALPLRDHRGLHAALQGMDAYVDISGFTLSSKWSIQANRKYLQRIELAKKHGKRVILLPQSFGPFDYGEFQAEMDERIPRVLAQADLLFAREEEGKRLLEQKYGLTNVRLSPDLVLQADEADWRNIAARQPELHCPALQTQRNVGIIPNTQTLRHGDEARILASYAALIEELLRRGRRVYIFCHSNDLEACRKIYAPFAGRAEVALLEQEFSCWEYSRFVEQFDYIVASRYHAIVHAYKRGVPALILGWAVKYRELAARFGQQDYVFDITGGYRDEALLAALDRLDAAPRTESERIREALREVRARSCFDACWELLDGGK